MAMWQKSFSCSQTQYMHFLDDICQEIVSGNLSASLEESSRFVEDNIIVQVDMFERYSFLVKIVWHFRLLRFLRMIISISQQ